MSKTNTKEQILSAASKLFQRQGYHGTGISQIIEESQTPKGSIYYHFPNGKEQIALESIHRMKDMVLQHAKEMLSTGNTAEEAFTRYFQSVADYFDHTEELEGFNMGLLASETSSSNETLCTACLETFKEWQQLFTETLVKLGYEETQAKEYSVSINALMEGACMLAITQKDGAPIRTVSQHLSLLFKKKTGGSQHANGSNDVRI